MKRYEYESAVYASNLDHYSKAILLYYGFCKNWNTDGKVWPSAKKIAADTGIGEATVKRRLPILREQGWLRDTGDTKVSGGRPSKVYDLGIPVILNHEDLGIPQSDLSITGKDLSITQSPLKYHSDTRTSNEQDIEEVKEQVISTSAKASVLRDEEMKEDDHSPSLDTVGVGRIAAGTEDIEVNPSLHALNKADSDAVNIGKTHGISYLNDYLNDKATREDAIIADFRRRKAKLLKKAGK